MTTPLNFLIVRPREVVVHSMTLNAGADFVCACMPIKKGLEILICFFH